MNDRDNHDINPEKEIQRGAMNSMSMLLKFYVQKVKAKIIPEKIMQQKIQKTRKNRRVH